MTLEQKKKEIEAFIQEGLKKFIGTRVDTLSFDDVNDVVVNALNQYLRDTGEPLPIPSSIKVTGNEFEVQWDKK